MKNAQRLNLRLPSINNSVIHAENLRTDPAGGLAPVGALPAINILDGSTPVGTYRHSSGTLYSFRLKGTSLEIIGDSESSTLISLPGEFRCMTPLNNAVAVMTSAGPVRLVPSANGWKETSGRTALPPVAVEVDSTATFAGVTPVYTLKGEYSHWRGPLHSADAEALSRNLRALFDRLSLNAAESGYFSQPVAVTYSVTDADGCTLAVSAPAVISPHGLQGTAPLNATAIRSGSVYTEVSGFPLELKAFNLRLRIPGLINRALSFSEGKTSVRFDGGTVHISVRQLTPVASKGVARFSFSTSDAAITACQATEPDPFSTDLFHPYTDIALPHSFSARTGATVGDMVVWGDITPLNALPPAPSALAASSNTGAAWTGCTRVTILLPDGTEEILTTTESGTSHAPMSLNPYVGYIHPRASRLEIMITETGGTSRYLSLPLSPHPVLHYSYYHNPSWMPVPIPVSDTLLSPVNRRSPSGRKHGMVAVAPVTDPFNIISSLIVTTGSVAAVTAARRSSSAWDFARRHLYVFSSTGIYAVAVNAARSLMSAHIIEPVSVDSPSRVADTPQGVMAVSDGKLLNVTGATAKLLSIKFPASAIAWNPRAMELWALRPDGVSATALDKDTHLRTDIGAVDSMHSAPGMLLLRRGSRYYNPLEEDDNAGCRTVKWSIRLDAPQYSPSRLNRIKWVMNASSAALTISVLGDNGSGHPHLIAKNFVKGAILAPVVMTFPSFPVRYLTFTVEGELSSDGRLNTIFLE